MSDNAALVEFSVPYLQPLSNKVTKNCKIIVIGAEKGSIFLSLQKLCHCFKLGLYCFSVLSVRDASMMVIASEGVPCLSRASLTKCRQPG